MGAAGMAIDKDTSVRTIGIFGGGKVGLHLLDLFAGSSLARVVYIVDREYSAPGLVRARSSHIGTFTDIDQALAAHNVDFIFEVTGSDKVLEFLRPKLDGKRTELVTHNMAAVILQVIEQRDLSVKTSVKNEILGIEHEIHKSSIDIQKLVSNIRAVAGEMVMLAMNARIEAARAGEHGRGFGVVAQKMGEAVDLVRAITPEIESVSNNILSVTDKIEVSLGHLE
jgi:hypothetical protein